MRTNTVGAITVTAALLVSACTPKPETTTWVSDPAPSGLAAGDLVQVVVFQQEDLSGEFSLDANGRLAMPLVGEIPAKGLSPQQLRDEIVDRLKPDYLRDPKVTVERIGIRPVYLLREVNQPGSYQHTESLTVAKAIALAGGLTYRASKSRISIRRVDDEGNAQEFKVDLNASVQGGDLINVPERFF